VHRGYGQQSLSLMASQRKLKGIRNVKPFLDEMVERYNDKRFIADDPISIPHRFSSLQDKEISGLFAATLAWGQRRTIIRNCSVLMDMMDNAPYEFVRNHQEHDLIKLQNFVHRTFNGTDLLYFISFLRHHYQQHKSLENLFSIPASALTVEPGLVNFHERFFSLPDFPPRTRKHVATPARGSACKRINMYLRWMVRDDGRGVDFGVWKTIAPRQLVCPCDLHVERVARRLGLIRRKAVDWQWALELTAKLRAFDPADPVKYDFALFGMGAVGEERW